MKPEAEAGQIALKEERHQYILELLGSEGRVLAADLSSRYRVSEDTIRRDLRELASSGKIQRVHGGALPRRAEAVPFVSRQQIDMESGDDCYQQPTACAGVGGSSEVERADARRKFS